ncbi:MAG: hypothetical protein FWE18_05610 [Alphaproteobacteria bacterium]|nr:hypothetical protein [Alphaproteobacteria bacterium]
MIKKIVIFTDCMKYYADKLDFHINKAKVFYNLFNFQLKKATGLPVETHFEAIDMNKFMLLNGLEDLLHLEKDSLFAYFYNNINIKAEEYLIESLKDCLIIGYHLPKLILNILIRNNIPYVDTFETSYRFMQDTYVGCRTNIKDAKDYLLSKSLSVNTMYVYANYLKAFYRNSLNYRLDNNSCLLIGQTSRDTVLIKKDSTFVSLLEYKDQIIAMSKKYKTLYYKMHPAESLPRNIREFLQSIPNAVEENRNFYELMAQDGIEEVFGLNSGAISEAKFFGKKRTFLFEKFHEYYQDEGDINNPHTFIILNSNSHIFKINFWADLLSSLVSVNKVEDNDEVYFDNYQSLFSSFMKVISSYEFNIYANYDVKKTVSWHNDRISNLESNIERLGNVEGNIYNIFERLNKRNNKFKKISINLLCSFVPTKQWRKKVRNKYLNH